MHQADVDASFGPVSIPAGEYRMRVTHQFLDDTISVTLNTD